MREKEQESRRRTGRVRVPLPREVTPEEIARRSKAVERVLDVRRRIGPIGIPVDELVHETRRERGCD